MQNFINASEKYVAVKIFRDAENKPFAKVFYKNAYGNIPAINPWEMRSNSDYSYDYRNDLQEMAHTLAKSILPYYSKNELTGETFLSTNEDLTTIPQEFVIVNNNNGMPKQNEKEVLSYDSTIAGCKSGSDNVIKLIDFLNKAVELQRENIPLFVYDGKDIVYVNEKSRAYNFPGADTFIPAATKEEILNIQEQLRSMAEESINVSSSNNDYSQENRPKLK